MTQTSPTLYRVFAAPGNSGGKRVAVFDAAGEINTAEMQNLAAGAGAPLVVFIQSVSVSDVVLRVFTPEREKFESESGALAALEHLFQRGQIPDLLSVQMAGEHSAQRCRGEWLLNQGNAEARKLATSPLDAARTLGLDEADLSPVPLYWCSAGRPNLALLVRDSARLDAATPIAGAIAELNHCTDTLGLIAACVPGRDGNDLDFRAFGPLKGFSEDNASSNTYASLLAALSLAGLLPLKERLQAGQGHALGQASVLSAQGVFDGSQAREVWVGGRVKALNNLEPA